MKRLSSLCYQQPARPTKIQSTTTIASRGLVPSLPTAAAALPSTITTTAVTYLNTISSKASYHHGGHTSSGGYTGRTTSHQGSSRPQRHQRQSTTSSSSSPPSRDYYNNNNKGPKSTHYREPRYHQQHHQHHHKPSSLSSTPIHTLDAEAATRATTTRHARSSSTTTPPTSTWSYAPLNDQGKSQLEMLYDTSVENVHRIFSTPLPSLPVDGSTAPLLAIGFSYYDHKVRDGYRGTLARHLKVPYSAIQLSTAWSSRYDVRQFPRRVQRVVGVDILIDDNDDHNNNEKQDETNAASQRQEQKDAASPSSAPRKATIDTMPPELSQALADFIKNVNDLTSPDLVALRMVRATTAVPEIVEGDGTITLPAGAQYSVADFIAAKALVKEVAELFTVVVFVAPGQPPPGILRMFTRHQKVPFVVDVGQGDALLGRIYGRSSSTTANEQQELFSPNSGSWAPKTYFKLSATTSSPQRPEAADDTDKNERGVAEEPGLTQASVSAANDKPTLTPHLLSDAVADFSDYNRDRRPTSVIHKQQEQADRGEKEKDTVLSSSSNHSRFPLVFIHGSFAGGLAELQYLQSNSRVLTTLLLHPSEVQMKQSQLGKAVARPKTMAENLNIHHN